MKGIVILAVMLVSGCAGTLHRETARQYYGGGQQAVEEGRWADARVSYGRAYSNAEMGNLPDRLKAVIIYEYGRTSGAVCDWEESEEALLKAVELDERTGGPVYMSLIELARMNRARGSLEASADYFGRAKTILDEGKVDTHDPLGYARVLAQYASVLDSLGREEEAAPLQARADTIRAAFPDRSPAHQQTPYGQFCTQQPTESSSGVS